MINDTQEARDELVQWMKDNKIYNPGASAAQLQAAHTVYWMLKGEERKPRYMLDELEPEVLSKIKEDNGYGHMPNDEFVAYWKQELERQRQDKEYPGLGTGYTLGPAPTTGVNWLPDLYECIQLTNDCGENERPLEPQRKVQVFGSGREYYQIGEPVTAVPDIYPMTIVCDRYQGAYSGGKYLAFNLDCEDIPEAVGAGDGEELEFWCVANANGEIPCGKGRTPDEAVANLAAVIEATKGGSK